MARAESEEFELCCKDYLPAELYKALFDFQKKGVLYGIRHGGRCLIGDEMGLGKTLQALSVAYYYRSEWPLLVLTPSSMRYTWVEEIERWLPEIEPTQINLIRGVNHVECIGTSAVTVVSYGLLSFGKQMFVQHLLNQKFQVVIVDESHYIKSRRAERSKTAVKLITAAKRAVLLSGTPAISRPVELYSQINALQPKLFNSWYKFAQRYCEGERNKFGHFECIGASNLEELYQTLTDHIMIRRLKSEVMQELPSKIRQKITFDTSEKGVKELQESFDQLKKILSVLAGSAEREATERHATRFDANSLLTKMFLQSGKAKIPGVLTYLSDFLEVVKRDVKCLVFAHHLVVQRAIAEMLVKANIGFIHIYGEVPPAKRQEYVKQFQEQPKTRVALLSLKAANIGLTLTAATHVVFAELYWNAGDLIQAEDRCHRIGQHQSVHVHYLIAKGTLDELLWLMLCRKVAVTSTTLNGKQDQLRAEEPVSNDLREFISACAACFSKPNSPQNSNLSQTHFKNIKRSRDMHKGLHSAVMLVSSPEFDSSLPMSESDNDEKLLDMELQPLRQRSKVKHRVSTRKHIQNDCMVNEDYDKVHDSSKDEFRDEMRKFRNCCQPVVRVCEATGSDSDSDTALPVFSTAMCVDCEEPAGSPTTWSCGQCTFINPIHAAACEMCDVVETSQRGHLKTNACQSPNRWQRDSQHSVRNPGNAKMSANRLNSDWACERCTYLNAADCVACKMCYALKPYLKWRDETQTDTVAEERECWDEASQVDCLEKKVCGGEVASSSRPNVCSRKGLVTIDLSETGNETDIEQKELPESFDSKVSFRRQITGRNSETGKMLMMPEVMTTNGSKVMESKESCPQTDTQRTETNCNAQTLAVESDASHSTIPLVVELSDTSSEAENEHNIEVSSIPSAPVECESDSCLSVVSVIPGTPHHGQHELQKDRLHSDTDSPSVAPVFGAKEVCVIPETPPYQSENEALTIESGDSDCCLDIDEFLFGDSVKKKSVHIVDELNSSLPPNSLDVSIVSEAGWDETLLEDVIGNEPDEWETETFNAMSANEKKTVEHGESSGNVETPTKRKQRHRKYPATSIIKHPDPLQRYCPPKAPQAPEDGHFMFYICHNTERIGLYTNDGRYLQCSVSASEVLFPVDESLPLVLQPKPNLQSVQCFVKDYVGLPVRDRALLKNKRCLIHDVRSELVQIKKNITKKQVYSRLASKEKFNETAIIAATEAAGGKLQVVDEVVHAPFQRRKRKQGSLNSRATGDNGSSENASGKKRKKDKSVKSSQRDENGETEPKTRQYLQGVLADGQKICATCTKSFKPLEIPKCTELPYGGRFCSRECYTAYLVKTNRQVGRGIVAEEEHGVCAMCNIDTGELLRNLKVLTSTEDRLKLLKETGHFSELSEKVLLDIVNMPKAGKLWHADHIVPVACGGGACSRENLRALCVPCHLKETKKVRKQARGRGCMDMRSCFSKPS